MPSTSSSEDPRHRVLINVTGDCGHVVWTGYDRVEDKYPFYCEECDLDLRTGRYPWTLETRIVAEQPDSVSSLPPARA